MEDNGPEVENPAETYVDVNGNNGDKLTPRTLRTGPFNRPRPVKVKNQEEDPNQEEDRIQEHVTTIESKNDPAATPSTSPRLDPKSSPLSVDTSDSNSSPSSEKTSDSDPSFPHLVWIPLGQILLLKVLLAMKNKLK